MAPLSSSAFADCCRAAEPATLVDFVAALYEARGWEIVDSDEAEAVFTAARGDKSERVGIASDDIVPEAVDTLVITDSAHEREAIEPARCLEPADLYNLLLYGIDRQAAGQLCDEWLGIQFDEEQDSTATDSSGSTTGPSADEPETFISGRHSQYSNLDEETDRQVSSTGHSRRRSPFRLGILVTAIVVGSVLLVFAAGGSWLSGQTGPVDSGAAVPGSTPTTTATPVSVTVPTTTATAVSRSDEQGKSAAVVPVDAPLAPGVDRSGIVEYQRLVDANRAQLESTSFRATLVYREFEDGTITGVSRQTVRVENATTYHASVVESGQFESAPPSLVFNDAYSNGSVVVDRTDDGISRRPVTGEGPFLDVLSRYLGYYLSVEDSRLVDYRQTGDRSVLQIATDGDPYPGVENATGSALVTDSGLVMQVWRAYDDPYSDVRVVVSIEVSDVGKTAITRPDWSY